MDEKGTLTENGKKVLGIMFKCRKHGIQRTVHIKDGLGCSKCYGIIRKLKQQNEENN